MLILSATKLPAHAVGKKSIVGGVRCTQMVLCTQGNLGPHQEPWIFHDLVEFSDSRLIGQIKKFIQ